MKKEFDIEHIGIIVNEPEKMAYWYKEVLGFNIIVAKEDSEKGMAFVTDAGSKVMLEFGKIPGVAPLALKVNHQAQLHIALKSDDPDRDTEYLISKGAAFIEKCAATLPGDNIVMLKDPWGNTLQLVKRGQPLKKDLPKNEDLQETRSL